MFFALVFRPIVLARVVTRLVYRLVRLVACFPCLVACVVVRRRRKREQQRSAQAAGRGDDATKTSSWTAKGRRVAPTDGATEGGYKGGTSSSAARESVRLREHLEREGGSVIVRESRAVAEVGGDMGAASAVGLAAAPPKRASCAHALRRATHFNHPERVLPHQRWWDAGSLMEDMETLRGALASIAPDAPEMSDETAQSQRKKRYTVLRARSAFDRGERHLLVRTLVGWSANFVLLGAFTWLYVLYMCEFWSLQLPDNPMLMREVLFAWMWSVGQKVAFNDPLVILSARGLPMLLRSKLCACCCSEACVEYVGHGIEAGGSVLKELAG